MTEVLLLACFLQKKDLKVKEVIGLKSPSKLLVITIIIRIAIEHLLCIRNYTKNCMPTFYSISLYHCLPQSLQ